MLNSGTFSSLSIISHFRNPFPNYGTLSRYVDPRKCLVIKITFYPLFYPQQKLLFFYQQLLDVSTQSTDIPPPSVQKDYNAPQLPWKFLNLHLSAFIRGKAHTCIRFSRGFITLTKNSQVSSPSGGNSD